MPVTNLGILAHVDAGKTSLTERLLYEAGVIPQLGSVDRGTTQTDTLLLERQRGITIKSAVACLHLQGMIVNLIDTPGHPDFIAEVERALGVLDGAILILSAVEGVQPQTLILMRALRRLDVPTLLFVNKIDRSGADPDRVLDAIRARLGITAVPLAQVREPGSRSASVEPWDVGAEVFDPIVEGLANYDDEVLEAFANGMRPDPDQLRGKLAAETARTRLYPVFFGSALTGAGVELLMHGIRDLLPSSAEVRESGLSGRVFKIERGSVGEKIAYVRIFSGVVRVRDVVSFGPGHRDKVTRLAVFTSAGCVPAEAVEAGEIGKLWGLRAVRVGDPVGEVARPAPTLDFLRPTLETVVVPRSRREAGHLRAALDELAEQDPLISLRQDDERHELWLSLYGEVQKEVIAATLALDYGVEAEFRPSSPLYAERPLGIGEAVERLHEGGNPFLASVGLRVEPAPAGSGVAFRIEAERGRMPRAYFQAVEDTVRETLRQGLYGWQVIGCVIVQTEAGYVGKHGLGHQYFNKSMSSTGEDYRKLTPLVLMEALKQARTEVVEPVHRFHLDVPSDSLVPVMRALTRLGAVVLSQMARGSSTLLAGDLPALAVHDLQQALPVMTSGEGVLEVAFDHYQPVRGKAPVRRRTDANPLDRKNYLLTVQRGVAPNRAEHRNG